MELPELGEWGSVVETCRETRAVVAVWPGAGGDPRSFAARAKVLAEAGVTSVLFDPFGYGAGTRDCGNEGPSFAFDDAADRLSVALDRLPHAPLFAMGHSMGAFGVLQLAERRVIERMFLVAPVLDSRASIDHLRAQGELEQLFRLFNVHGQAADKLARVLSDPTWAERWRALGPASGLDLPSQGTLRVDSIATFLEEILVTGFSGWRLLEHAPDKAHVFLPADDDWFPLDITAAYCRRHGIELDVVREARGHAFSGGFGAVFQHMLATIPTKPRRR